MSDNIPDNPDKFWFHWFEDEKGRLFVACWGPIFFEEDGPFLWFYFHDGTYSRIDDIPEGWVYRGSCQTPDEIDALRTERDEAKKAGEARCAMHDNDRIRLTAALAHVRRLEEALAFYGDVSKYPAPFTGGMGDLWSDCGQIARAALATPATEDAP